MADRRAVVIGGGITGTLTGCALLRAGWEVTLIEALHIGAGSSSRTAAGIRQQFSTRESVLGMRYSVDFYKHWQQSMGQDGQPIEQNGYLFLVQGEDAWKAAQKRVSDQQNWGLTEVQALSPQQTVERFSYVDPEEITGATWCPSDGFLRPDVVYSEAAAAFRALGGTLLQGSPLVQAERAGERLISITTGKGAVLNADVFLDCTNAWSRRVGDILGAAHLPIQALKRYLWFIERGDSMSEAELLKMPLIISPQGAYCRPENAGSLMTGWKHQAPDVSANFAYDDQDIIEPAYFHKNDADSRPFETWMALAQALPPVGEFAGISATTAGFYGTTPDHNPFLDFDPQTKNLIRMVGFSGHGAMFGPFSAQVGLALAEAGESIDHVRVLGEDAELAPFKINRDFGAAEAMVI